MREKEIIAKANLYDLLIANNMDKNIKYRKTKDNFYIVENKVDEYNKILDFLQYKTYENEEEVIKISNLEPSILKTIKSDQFINMFNSIIPILNENGTIDLSSLKEGIRYE